jgi:hypothetical protein
MYPSQTSLIPLTVAIARFLEINGFRGFFDWYDFWYLGLPAKFIVGPIVPSLVVGLGRLVPSLSYFEATFGLLLLSFILAAVGLGRLVAKISKNSRLGFIVGMIVIFLPWRYLSALALEEASLTIARNILPFVLLAFYSLLITNSRKWWIASILLTALILLINTSILPILLVGVSSLTLTRAFRKGKIRSITKHIKSLLPVLGGGLLLATFWYTPSYWATVLVNPSIGGLSAARVILRVFDLLKASLPLFLAVVAVYFSGRIKSRILVFSFCWMLTFAFLTLFRFIGDSDFWQDWSSWFYELEIGIAFLMAQTVVSVVRKNGYRYSIKIYIVIFILLLLPYWLSFRIYNTLGKPALISQNIPQGVYALTKLAEIAGEKRVFLSGATVFWANSLYDINQVRGGQDKVAIYPYWDHAAYQIREGDDPKLTSAWLSSLGVSYALVHGSKSAEYYQDYKNISKWKKVGKIVWEGDGDFIVEVADSSLAWVVELSRLKSVKTPFGGADLDTLEAYLDARKRPLEVLAKGSNKLVLGLDEPLRQGEAVVIARSYHRRWKSPNFRVQKDPIGNILLIGQGYDYFEPEIELKY